jgi:hypothetical protein
MQTFRHLQAVTALRKNSHASMIAIPRNCPSTAIANRQITKGRSSLHGEERMVKSRRGVPF